MTEIKEERNSQFSRSERLSLSKFTLPGQIIDSLNVAKQDKCEEAQLVTNHDFATNVNFNLENYKLHIAAKNNDIEKIKLCIKSYNFDVEDKSVDSPLLIAVIYENYEAARILKQAHVDVLSEKPLEQLFYKTSEMVHTKLFVAEMLTKNFDSARIGRVLVELNCNVRQVVKFRDSVMMKTFLQFTNHEDIDNTVARIPDDMFGFDLEYIRILITCEPGSCVRKHEFVLKLTNNIEHYEKTKEGRDFIEKLCRSEFLDKEFFTDLQSLFSSWHMSKKAAKLFLKYGFHRIAKEKYGRIITCNLIGNDKPEVILWMKNQDINVDKRFWNRDTFLHIATTHTVARNIEFLLKKGADPNARNDNGVTPFNIAIRVWDNRFSCTEESVKLLLFTGGDLMTLSHHFDGTFFGLDLSQSVRQSDMNIVKLFIARLAIYEADGQSVAKPMNALKMFYSEELDKYLEKCRNQLKTLKTHEILGTDNMKFSILRILNEKPEKLARYVNKNSLKQIKNCMAKYNANSLNAYYIELLKRQVKVISEIRPCRKKAIQIVCQFTGIQNSDHLIVQKIVEYFTVRELLIFKNQRFCFFKRKPKINIFE